MTLADRLAESFKPPQKKIFPKGPIVQEFDERTEEMTGDKFHLQSGTHLVRKRFITSENLGTFVEDPTGFRRLLLLIEEGDKEK